MRKLIIWFLVALMALSGFALAETAQPAAGAVNGRDAVRIGADIYMAIPSGTRQMLVRVPTGGGEPICVDRGDRFEDLIPYGSGLIYLKTENGSSAIMSFDGSAVSTVYGFGSSSASCLSSYDGKLWVLIDGLLHSIDPGTQLCLRGSGSEMTDYVMEGGSAYYLSAGDRMEYTATLEDGQTVSTQAGCVYSLDLSNGSTMLLLKSGGRDLQIANGTLYFHNLADAYAVRLADGAQLMGRVHSLDVQQHSLGDACADPDNGFWALDGGLVVWYNGALNTETEAGTLALYAPENGATVASDGKDLYIWESGKAALTQAQLNGTQTVVYSGDLTQAKDLSLMVPASTPGPSATAGSDMDPEGGSGWFTNYVDGQSNSSGSSSSGGSSSGGGIWTQATPIGATAAPAPTPVALNGGSSSSGGSSSGSSSSSGGSSGGTTSSGDTYGVDISYVRITGGSVNVRKGPGTGYAVITTLRKGAIVKCTGRAAKDNDNNTWYQIQNGGTKGWVSAGYAKKSSAPDANYSGPEQSMSGSTVTITGASVNVRAKPNLNGADLGVVKKGAKLSFQGKYSTDGRGVDWYKVSYEGKTGWVSSRYSKVSGSSGGSSSGGGYSGGSDASGTMYTSGTINIRTGPGKKYDSIGTIPKGTKLTVEKKAADAAGRNVTWYRVTYKGKTGWVSGVNLSSSASSGSSGSGSSGGSTSKSGSGKTTGQVNLRSKANRNSSSVAIVPKGTTLKYTKTAPDGEGRKGITWYYVSYKGKSGWVSSMYFK